jgi:hypothetical protein
MFTFRRHLARLEASRIFRLVVLGLSACVFAAALYLAWLAFTDPLELEIREGSTWMLALAKRAGVDLYDTRRVAFVNMNHGPLDAILKGWLARLWPGLPGHAVTRAFVLLCPVFLFGAAYVITRRHLAAAMLAAGALFLLFSHMSWMMFVGRPDATAVCGMAVCGALAHRLLMSRHTSWSKKRYAAAQLGLGAASAAVFLTSWRFAPVVAALQFVVLFGSRVPGRRMGFAKHLAISTVLYLAGFAAVWLPVFVFELHGDLRSYYRHFFGFFTPESGWGAFAGAHYYVVPPELLRTRLAIILLFAALILGGLYRLRRQEGERVAWLLMLPAAWMAVSYGYFKNQSGGGLHYFFEFFVFAWIFVLHAFCRVRRWGAVAQLLLVAAVVLAMPSRDLLAQAQQLAEARAKARTFRDEVARLTGGYPVFGEETHFLKSNYHGERVDTGDTDSYIAGSGYFGEAFTQTYEAYKRDLVAKPPRFVIGGLLGGANQERLMSSTLQDLIRRRYTLRLTADGTCLANGGSGSGQALFERND